MYIVHDILNFSDVDKNAPGVVNLLWNHWWYLSEEVVPFALFSKYSAFRDSMKQDTATELLLKPENLRLGKPLFRQLNRYITLKGLIEPESHTLFLVLNGNTCWLVKTKSRVMNYEVRKRIQTS